MKNTRNEKNWKKQDHHAFYGGEARKQAAGQYRKNGLIPRTPHLPYRVKKGA